VQQFIFSKLKLLKLGSQMLLSNDLHINQIIIFLKMISTKFAPFLTATGVLEDFDKILESIKNNEAREKDLVETQLSQPAQAVQYNESSYKNFLPTVFLKQFEGLQQRSPREWLTYEQFINCVILPKSQDAETELPFLGFNLMAIY
jgi:hypothetical protein